MGFFSENQLTDIWKERKEYIIYRPQREKLDYIYKQVEENTKIIEDDNKQEDELSGTFGYDLIKYIIINLTNVGEEVKDLEGEEFQKLLENGNRKVKLLMEDITDLITEIMKDLMDSQRASMKSTLFILDMIEVSSGVGNVGEKLSKMLKKKGVNVTPEEALVLLQNQEELSKRLELATKKPKPIKKKK